MKQRRPTIAVKSGETYKVPRAGKPAAFVKLVRVRKGDQPKVTYERVTRSGGKRPGESVNVRWLTFRDGAWRLPENWLPA